MGRGLRSKAAGQLRLGGLMSICGPPSTGLCIIPTANLDAAVAGHAAFDLNPDRSTKSPYSFWLTA